MLSLATRRVAQRAARLPVQRSMSVALSEDANTPIMNHEAPSFGDVQVSNANGVTVITEGGVGAAGKVSVVVGAGSRNEDASNVGVTSVLQKAAFQSNESSSALAVERHNSASGVNLASCTCRECTSFVATFPTDAVEVATTNLLDSVTKPSYLSWEVNDVKKLVETSACSKTTVINALHTGAFHTGLGNSSTCLPFKLGGISDTDLKDFHAKNFAAGNTTVVGTGVDHDDLVAAVSQAFEGMPQDGPSTSATKYYGGAETRTPTADSNVVFAVAFEGASAGSSDQTLAALLAKLVTGAPAVKYGNKTGSAALASLDVETLNFNYNDSGLFGISVTSSGDAAASDISNAVAGLKSVLGGDFDDAAVQKAKAALKLSVLDMGKSSRADFYASQGHGAVTPESYADAIDAVTTASLKAFAKKVGGSKPVVAAAGDVASAPFASDLSL